MKTESVVATQIPEEEPIPEFISQRMAVQSGEKTWDDFTFEERTCKGWLIPYLLDIDAMFWGRWNYWYRTLEARKLLDNEPIPKIDFIGEGDRGTQETSKMLEKCMDHYVCMANSVRLPDFLEWILWGFGQGENRPRAAEDEKVNEHWYRTFNMGLMIKHPHDYLGEILSDNKSGRWNNPNAFYPTPHHVVDMMVRMQFEGDEKDRDIRALSVMDPCVGTGRFLMYASNYSVNLYGADIDYVCVMATKINGYLYMPWLIRPAPWLCMTEPIQNRNSLLDPITEPAPSKKVVSIGKGGQLKLF